MMSRRSACAAAILAGCAALTSTAVSAAEPDIRSGVGSASSPATSGTRSSTSVQSFITFDTGTSPCAFDDTSPLRDEYAELGVRFRGAGPSTGGAVLNECGNFGVRARSGLEFLAFNADTYATTPEHLRFSALQRSVQMYVANGHGQGESTYTLTGWREGSVVVRTSITTTMTGWLAIRVAHVGGMGRVTLRANVPDGAFVVDDLQYKSLS